MRRLLIPFVLTAVLNLTGFAPVHAFGKNKVIVKQFDWKVSRTQHFDIYYYDKSGENLLPYVKKYLENSYVRNISVIPAAQKERYPFFIYNNHNDFEQSNVTDIGEGTGGVTEAFKSRFLVGNTGSQRYLQHVVAHELVHELQFEKLLEGFWRSAWIAKSILYPLWLMEGLAEYSSGDYDSTTREMFLRDAVTSDTFIPLSELQGFNHVLPHHVTLAYKESEGFMYYLAGEYGEENLYRMLDAYRSEYDPDSVLRVSFGASLSVLDKRYREFLDEKYLPIAKGLKEPEEYGKKLTKDGKFPAYYESAVFSNDSKRIAYISDKTGASQVYIYDIASEKEKPLTTASHTPAESIYSEGSGLSFSSDDKTLIFAGKKNHKDRLYLMDTATGRVTEEVPGTETCASPCFSFDDKKIFFSGLKDGGRNIFAYDLSSKVLTQLTTGHLDKVDVFAANDGRYIYFSCERENPAGRIEYDISRLDLRSGEQVFLVSQAGDERYPFVTNDGRHLYFTSDADGILDIYSMEMSSGRITRITNVIGGNFTPRVSSDGKNLLFSSFRRCRKNVYLMELDKAAPAENPGGPLSKTALFRVARSSSVFADDAVRRYKSAPSQYRFRASTDLFYLFIFYSSDDGLYLVAYWQASEFLGNHVLSAYAQFSGSGGYLDYSVTYGYLKFRPQFYLNAEGSQYNEYYINSDLVKTVKDETQTFLVLYPLNKADRIELGLATTQRKSFWKDIPSTLDSSVDNKLVAGFSHDVTEGPYFESTSGWAVSLKVETGHKVLGGDYDYQNGFIEARSYFPLGGEHVFAVRNYLAGSFGIDRNIFRLGGVDAVRGYPADYGKNSSLAGHRVFLSNFEWRIPLVTDINYHVKFMFPDFFFRTLYGTVFTDAGFAWNEDAELKAIDQDRWKSSYGAGLKFYTFLLETYPVLLNFQLARRYENETAIFYFSLSSSF